MTHIDIARHLKTEVCFNLWSFGTSQLSYASLDSRRFKKQYLIGSGPVMKGRRTLAVLFFFQSADRKSFTCRLVFVEFRQVDDKIGACRARHLKVLDLKTSCRALSASVRWTKTICRGSRLPQLMRNCHESRVNKRLFQHGSAVLI